MIFFNREPLAEMYSAQAVTAVPPQYVEVVIAARPIENGAADSPG
ncbi:MAG: hypothetical protein U0694_21105 [Anaerolineae bacterium]